MKYSKIITKRIRFLCEKRKLSINKLAEMSNVKQSTLDHIMQNVTKNPGIKTLYKIANTFNMTVAEFLNYEELNEYSFADREED